MRPESSKRFQVNEISFPASGYEPEGREFAQGAPFGHMLQQSSVGTSADCVVLVDRAVILQGGSVWSFADHFIR